jgi:hypothetical protein
MKSERYILVSDATCSLLDAAERVGHCTRKKLPYPENQLISICSTDIDHYTTADSTVDLYREALTALHANDSKRLTELRSTLRDSQTKYAKDSDHCEELLTEIQKITDKHCVEHALAILQAGTGRCGDYSAVEKYHAFIDPRMSKLNAQICHLELKECFGDHNIVSFRDPRHNLAKEIPTSESWSPMGSASLMSERDLHDRETDWNVYSLTEPHKNLDKDPSESFCVALKSMNFSLKKKTHFRRSTAPTYLCRKPVQPNCINKGYQRDLSKRVWKSR